MYHSTKTAFCNAHVHQVTFVIAVISVILQVVWSFQQVIFHSDGNMGVYKRSPSVFSVSVGILLGFLINGTLLYGNLKRRSSFYWPYMMFNGLLLAISVFGGVFAFIFVMSIGFTKGFDGVSDYHEYYVYGLNGTETAVIYGEDHPLNPHHRQAFFASAFLFIIFYALSVLVQWYLFTIVVRDYKHLRAQDHFAETYDQLEKEFEYRPQEPQAEEEKDAKKIVFSA